MFRIAHYQLDEWRLSARRKPLIIRGARQVGKTWLMKSFGEKEYSNTAYINFDNNERMHQLFDGDFSITRIISGLEIESGETISAGKTLIIFDEVQEVPKALSSLKYFFENAQEHHIVAAGSLLGVALHPGTSFPVGKVSFLDLYPMNFYEFVHACGDPQLIKLFDSKDWSLSNTFSDKFTDLLKKYYYVGGMPEVVEVYRARQDFVEVRALQNDILEAYEQDLSKHAPAAIVPRLRMLWDSIASQLSKENKKFMYGLIKKGSRAREYEMAMSWLIDCGLIHKVSRVNKPGIPLKAYEDLKSFKLFILDVGLLAAMSSIDVKTLLEGNAIFTEFKGALTEQFVLQELKSAGRQPFYWSHERGEAEIDFLLQSGSDVVPIEVKAEINLRAKSLKSYRQKFVPELSLRASLANYNKENGLVNIPLYMLSHLSAILDNE